MPISRKKKEEVVLRLKTLFEESEGVVFTDYQGLTVEEMEEVKSELRKEGGVFMVAKNTLITKALEGTKYEDLKLDDLSGPVAVAFSTDEVAPARIVHNFGKDHENLEIRFGFLEGKKVEADKVKELALLPGKDELIAKAVGSIAAPLSGLVRVLSGNVTGLVTVLKSIGDNKETK